MPYDGSVVYAIVHELNRTILNGKIDKIYQPEKDELIINIRSYRDNYKLLLSASPAYPRVHLTEESKSNPAVPPTFCMLLRKHLTGGRIIAISQPQFERIIEIDVECFDELGYSNIKTLTAEIMGRHSNIIFLDKSSDKIIDSVKRVNFEVSSVREVLPGRSYIYPPSGGRLNPLAVDHPEFLSLLDRIAGAMKAEKFLIGSFNGISPAVAREICGNAGLGLDANLSESSSQERQALWDAFRQQMSLLEEKNFAPRLFLQEDRVHDFFCTDLSLYNGMEKRGYDSMSRTVEQFFFEKDQKDRIKQKSGDVYRLITARLDRCYKKLEVFDSELTEARAAEKYKIYGDLIMSNLYQLQKGQDKAVLSNYYSPEGALLEIPLDVQLSPSANAQRYYRYYNKSKNALTVIQEQIQENRQEIYYLESLLDNVEKCTEGIEIEEIRNELIEQGYIKARRLVKNKQQKPSKPMHFLSSGGMDIYVGKNNVQNDYLTIKLASPTDLWFHTKDLAGSHVIVKSNGQKVDDRTLEEAALLAAYYSKGKMSSKVPVDYTLRKNVKKPAGSKPGMVIYENFKTVYMTPDEKQIKALKQMDQ